MNTAAWKSTLWFEKSAHVCVGYTTKNQPPLSPKDIKLMFSIDNSVLFNLCRGIDEEKKEVSFCVCMLEVVDKAKTWSDLWSDDRTDYHRGEELALSANCVISVIKCMFSFSFCTVLFSNWFSSWTLIYWFAQRSQIMPFSLIIVFRSLL